MGRRRLRLPYGALRLRLRYLRVDFGSASCTVGSACVFVTYGSTSAPPPVRSAPPASSLLTGRLRLRLPYGRLRLRLRYLRVDFGSASRTVGSACVPLRRLNRASDPGPDGPPPPL